jgi:DNA-binding NtrC family response regulator
MLMSEDRDGKQEEETRAPVHLPRRTIEYGRPTVEVQGQPLSEGFPVEKLQLTVVDGVDVGVGGTFEQSVIRIGADPLCDVALTDPTVSRMHAELRRRGDALELIDLKSTNGTYVDGINVGTVDISTRSLFQVGKTHIRVAKLTEQVAIEVTDRTRYGSMIGRSAALREIFSILDRVAPSDLSVVIEGETGSGKELIARAIHENSNRSDQPFVVFDCSAFPATLLESELFGHERGAFSGADRRHHGVFERANGGTIFFDELGEMDIEFQSKFLRVLETGDVRRVGGEKMFHVDVRVVAATNRNLDDLVEEKKFRSDLYYRLAKVRFRIPALRDRVEDIPLLAEYFLNQMCTDLSAKPLLTEDAVRALQEYRWPGNIRELRNVVERAVAFCDEGIVTASYFRSELDLSLGGGALGRGPDPLGRVGSGGGRSTAIPLGPLEPFRQAKEAVVADFELGYLRRLLEINGNNISKAAREAQIDRRHLYRLLKKHELID